MGSPQLAPGQLGRTLETVDVAGARVNRAVYRAGSETPEHVHPLANLCVTLDGRYEEQWGRRRDVFDTSSVLVKPPGVEHRNRFGPTDVLCLNIEFGSEAWEELGCGVFDGPRRLVDPRLRRLGCELERELTHPDRRSLLAAQGLVLSIVTTTLRADDRLVDGSARRWLEDVRDRLHDEYATNLRLDVLAAEAGVHPSHLARRFRARFGRSISDYVRELRVTAAIRALVGTDRPLSRVALECGFSDQSHLGRVIRRETGRTPGEWRRGGGSDRSMRLDRS